MASLPFKIQDVTKEEDLIIKKYYKRYTRPFVKVGPAGYILTPGFKDHMEDIYKLDVRPDDTWVVTFSRAGTTWMQELIWLVINNLDFERAKTEPVTKRFAFIEHPLLSTEWIENYQNHGATEIDFRTLPGVTSPRYVKTHLPLSLLPPTLLDTAKVIYVARDIRDVAVSYFFMHKLFRYFDDSVEFKDYWDLFKNDLLLHMPILPHIEEAWQKRDHPNMLFVFYEEMQKDLLSVINRACKFYGREYTAEQKEQLAQFLSFDSMKKHSAMPGKDEGNPEIKFMRKGQSGNWINYFNETMKLEADDYMRKYLDKSDLKFPEV